MYGLNEVLQYYNKEGKLNSLTLSNPDVTLFPNSVPKEAPSYWEQPPLLGKFQYWQVPALERAPLLMGKTPPHSQYKLLSNFQAA